MKFGMLVSGDFFRVLNVQPILGRGFRPDEDQPPGRDAVAVLGYALWENAFAGSPDAIGSIMFLNGIAFTVVGVAPESLTGALPMIQSALYVPMSMGVEARVRGAA
jgi:putative ABC transport system permease protein